MFQIEADIEPEQVREVQPALESSFGLVEDGFDSTSVGPTFGEQVARSAVYAIIFSLLVITAYVAFRFEPKYAVPVIIAVIHDILITGGVYSLAEREVTSGTVAAFLTILGYSLYDTVIVFDRIRENVPRLPRATFSQIVNRSMSEVLTRSLITGLSSVFLVTVLYIFGGATLQDFAFAMMVGIASGTYSSIFIAAPVLTAWKEREPAYRRRRERIEEQMGRVPPFPEENVIARLEGEDREAVRSRARRPPSRRRLRTPQAPGAGPVLGPRCASPSRPGRSRPRPSRRSPPLSPRARRPRATGKATGEARSPSSARRAPLRCAASARARAAGASDASTGGPADGCSGLVHDGRRALALHRVPSRPLPRRHRRRLRRRRRRGDGDRRRSRRSRPARASATPTSPRRCSRSPAR